MNIYSFHSSCAKWFHIFVAAIHTTNEIVLKKIYDKYIELCYNFLTEFVIHCKYFIEEWLYVKEQRFN